MSPNYCYKFNIFQLSCDCYNYNRIGLSQQSQDDETERILRGKMIRGTFTYTNKPNIRLN